MNLYERLMEFKRPGESMKEFAARAGLSQHMLGRWKFVGSEGFYPRVTTIIYVADNLKTSPEYLLFGCHCGQKEKAARAKRQKQTKRISSPAISGGNGGVK